MQVESRIFCLDSRSGFETGLWAELARLDRLLGHQLAAMRKRGRSVLADAVGGAVIEEGEAEGLLQSLQASHCGGAMQQAHESARESALKSLEQARRLYGLSAVERDLLLVGLAVEIDLRYARLIGFLNDHVSMTRPTVGLALAVVESDESNRLEVIGRLAGQGPLRQFALAKLDGDGPLSHQSFAVSNTFWPRLVGFGGELAFSLEDSGKDDLERLELPVSLRQRAEQARRWAAAREGEPILLVVGGRLESGREALARAILAVSRPKIIVVDGAEMDSREKINALERDARWHHAAVVVNGPERLSAALRGELLAELSAPLAFIAGAEGSGQLVEGANRTISHLVIGDRDGEAKERLWNHCATLQGAESTCVSSAAVRYDFGPRRIMSALRMAREQADCEGGRKAGRDDVEWACRRLQETQFGNLAQRLPCPFAPEDIVLPAKTRSEMDLIIAWARHGDRLFRGAGQGARLRTGRGLACLFSGPPGTGKTMAAQIISRQLNCDIYRIDLSQVVNKYIGETEKNLSKVFEEAQRSRVVLFFDEADALFGRRSEVKDAHDRYANVEVGYLLQQLESYEGLAILATNLPKNLDDAFLRRLQVAAEFPIPQMAERRQIWDRLLPTDRSGDLDLDILSRRFEIAGGDIRNAIFTALLLAAEDESALGMRHVVLGLWRELQKSGRVVDLAHFGVWKGEIELVLGGAGWKNGGKG